MRLERFTFGSIRIDGTTYDHDVVIDRGKVRERRKKPSKRFRHAFGHAPLSVQEKIPWNCRRLVVGTGAHGALPVMDEVRREAARRRVELLRTKGSPVGAIALMPLSKPTNVKASSSFADNGNEWRISRSGFAWGLSSGSTMAPGTS
jgi:hypothetical protein